MSGLAFNTDQYTPEQLFGNIVPVVTMPITVKTGEGVVAANTVLGEVTADLKFRAYASGNSDGSEVAQVILTEEVDATSEDVATTAYVSGVVNKDKLVGVDAAAISQLRKVGIYVKEFSD